MTTNAGAFRFLMIQAFSLPATSTYRMRPMSGAKESMLMNHADFAPLLRAVTAAPGPVITNNADGETVIAIAAPATSFTSSGRLM